MCMKYIYPTRIVAQGENTNHSYVLMNESILQIGLSEAKIFSMIGKTYIILDFGKELSGGIRLLTYHADGNKKIRLRFGESVSETCAELGEKNAGNDHSNRDFVVELQSFSDMNFGNTGFRFLRIDTLSESVSIKFKSIVAYLDMDEREEVGFFECNDPLVNRIWTTAAYTLRLCLHNGFLWDGIKRDRLVWIGDLYPEMKSAHCLYQKVPEVENSLRYIREQTPLPEWMNGIPMYSFWWLIILCDHYFRNGDKNFVYENIDYIKALVKQIYAFVREDGHTEFCYNFVDWPSHYNEGDGEIKKHEELAGVNYLLRIALEKTAQLLREFGEDNRICNDVLRKLKRASFLLQSSKSMAALGIISGEKSVNLENILIDGQVKGLSTFMSYQILTAMGQLKAYDQALSSLNLYYGEMLRLGATTFWENFDFEDAKNSTGIDCLPEGNSFDIHGDGGEHTDHGKLSGVEDRLRNSVFLLGTLFQHHSHQETPHDDR